MKKYRLLSAFLALVLILSMLPMTTLASSKDISGFHSAYHNQQADGSFIHEYVFTDGTVWVQHGEVVQVTGDVAKLYPLGTYIKQIIGGKHYYSHIHSFEFHTTRSGHGLACTCGQWHTMLPHDDPLEAEDGRCQCGYQYMSNAQLTVLWMRNVQLSPRFSKDTLTYTGKLTKDVDEITLVTAKRFDEMARLDAPESYKLKPGTNTFEFTVTAEDGKTTQTYTVTIEK